MSCVCLLQIKHVQYVYLTMSASRVILYLISFANTEVESPITAPLWRLYVNLMPRSYHMHLATFATRPILHVGFGQQDNLDPQHKAQHSQHPASEAKPQAW